MAEHDEVIAVLLFFIIVFSALLVINSTGKSAITGMAVAETKENVLEKIKVFMNKLDFLSDVEESNFCIIIHMDDSTAYSYKVVKIGDAIDVTSSDDLYCGGLNNNDFVFSYVSYASFLEHANGNPTFESLKASAGGQNFYILPSKYVESGMYVKNKEEFLTKYEKIFDRFSAAEQKQFLTTAAAAGRMPSATIPMGAIYGGAAFLISIILIIVLVPKLMQKPTIEENLQLVTYIKSAIAKGYTEDNIKQALIGSGWPEKIVEQAMIQATQSAEQLAEQTEEATAEATEATTEQLVEEAKSET